jgi:hypothetical protein
MTLRRDVSIAAILVSGWAAASGLLIVPAAPAKAETPAAPAIERQLQALVAAYPEHLDRLEGNAIVWSDGTRMAAIDGRKEKSFENKLANPDILDMFSIAYVQGPTAPPGFQEDPGRFRHQPFFDKMYGNCRKGEVERHLTDVAWLPKHQGGMLRVTTVNGVAEKLARVSAELDALPGDRLAFLKPAAGGYNCRTIAGTDRVSAHGHGIAVDIAVARADYWRWQKPDASGRYRYRNSIPPEIVAIFEKHGFIWGGKWYHFDTMHFEYRPELLAASR